MDDLKLELFANCRSALGTALNYDVSLPQWLVQQESIVPVTPQRDLLPVPAIL